MSPETAAADEKTFRGTAICRKSGERLEIVEGWPRKPDGKADRRAFGVSLCFCEL